VLTTEERVSKVEEALAFFMTETARLFAEIREDIAEIRASNARTDRLLLEMQQRADKERQQAEKDRRDFNRRLAEITDSQGLLIENMVWPNLKRVATEVFKGGEVHFQAIRLKRRMPTDLSRMLELDLLAVGASDVLICEAKSKVSAEKVREFLQSIQLFGEFFPEHAEKRVWPMIASVMIDASVVNFMTSQRVLALGFGDETMDLLNPEALG
jgi:hypothetical protein